MGTPQPGPSRVARVVSGGQTGVDRAALVVAQELGIALGGWCPAGGWAEDLPEPPGVRALFPQLRETPGADPAERTLANVRDSDATLVVVRDRVLSVGTERTVEHAVRLGRPHLVIDVDQGAAEATAWLDALDGATVLNVAGPRESQAPGIQEATRELLRRVLPASPME